MSWNLAAEVLRAVCQPLLTKICKKYCPDSVSQHWVCVRNLRWHYCCCILPPSDRMLTLAKAVTMDHEGSEVEMPYKPLPYPSAAGAICPSLIHCQNATPFKDPVFAFCKQYLQTSETSMFKPQELRNAAESAGLDFSTIIHGFKETDKEGEYTIPKFSGLLLSK